MIFNKLLLISSLLLLGSSKASTSLRGSSSTAATSGSGNRDLQSITEESILFFESLTSNARIARNTLPACNVDSDADPVEIFLANPPSRSSRFLAGSASSPTVNRVNGDFGGGRQKWTFVPVLNGPANTFNIVVASGGFNSPQSHTLLSIADTFRVTTLVPQDDGTGRQWWTIEEVEGQEGSGVVLIRNNLGDASNNTYLYARDENPWLSLAATPDSVSASRVQWRMARTTCSARGPTGSFSPGDFFDRITNGGRFATRTTFACDGDLVSDRDVFNLEPVNDVDAPGITSIQGARSTGPWTFAPVPGFLNNTFHIILSVDGVSSSSSSFLSSCPTESNLCISGRATEDDDTGRQRWIIEEIEGTEGAVTIRNDFNGNQVAGRFGQFDLRLSNTSAQALHIVRTIC